MRNYCWWLIFVACCLNLGSIKAKPLVSFGLGVQTSRPYPAPYTDPYYSNYYGYYGRYPTNYPYYSSPYYPAPYYPAETHYGGTLDFGIGALSLNPFLL